MLCAYVMIFIIGLCLLIMKIGVVLLKIISSFTYVCVLYVTMKLDFTVMFIIKLLEALFDGVDYYIRKHSVGVTCINCGGVKNNK